MKNYQFYHNVDRKIGTVIHLNCNLNSILHRNSPSRSLPVALCIIVECKRIIARRDTAVSHLRSNSSSTS